MPSEKRQRQREGRLARQEELRRAQQQSRKRRGYIVGVVVVVLFGVVFYFVTKNNGSSAKKVSTGTSTTVVGGTSTTKAGATVTSTDPSTTTAKPAGAPLPCPKADGTSPHTTTFAGPPPTCIDAAKTYIATMSTDAGDVVIKLDPVATPKTVNNFVYLSGYHFFDGLIFHRVIPDFVDQGGDPTGTGNSGPGYQFADELPKAGAYKAGSVAMANSGPNTNGSQFFLVASDAGGQQLQPNYSLFGQVTGGMDVVTTINKDGDPSGTPKVVHKIVKVTIAVA